MTHERRRDVDRADLDDRLRRLVDRQLQVMEKQLQLMRSLASGDEAWSTRSATEAVVGDHRNHGPRSDSHVVAPAAISVAAEVAGRESGIAVAPMTDVQRDVWVNCQLSAGGSAAYNLSSTLSLQGDLDIDALREAVRLLVARHQSLRTTFDATGSYQFVSASAGVELPLVDLSGGSEAERGERVDSILDSEVTRPYDLVNGPLFRPRLLRLGDAEYLLILSGHHLICDGWSFGVMKRELGAIYSALTRGAVIALEDVVQYVEYADWHDGERATSEAYWLDLYRDPPVQLDLPADKPRPPVRSFRYGSQRAVIDDGLLAAVKDMAAAQGLTPFVVLLGAWEILLHRLSGQAEFASGVFVSGQASMGARSLVGLCTNFLPLRIRAGADELVFDYLRWLKRATYEAIDNQHFSVGSLAQTLQLPRDTSRATLVSAVMTLETPTPGLSFAGLTAAEPVHGRRHFGSFDLEAYLTESPADLTVDLDYSTDLFEADTIRRWLEHYTHLLRQMSADPSVPLRALRLLDDEERRDLLLCWNDTRSAVPDQRTHERVEAQAAAHPDSVAVRTTEGSLTYAELNERANRLARHLRKSGVDRDRLVGIHVERSPEMLVALLAVQKAGGAYVPLDPLFPAERLRLIASEAGLHVLVTQASLLGTTATDAAVVALDRDRQLIDEHDGSDLGITVSPTDLAYVIYTSGSTGRPKGVEVPHGALDNLLEAMRRRPGLDAEDVLLAVTTMSFDISALELYLPLICGATVVLADEREAVDAVWLRQRLAEGDITVLQATPATWQLLLDGGWTGTAGLKALCGGEALSQELAATLGSCVAELWNMYGPTETTIWSSAGEVDLARGPVSIGEPILNTELHVLDPSGEVQPLGVPGELYIGGTGLARGYRHREDLTAERFAEHRFGDEPPRRLYRTGDLVRRSADGRIEYLGRTDFQVKIRGYRIELGEIETVLARHPDVKECVVVARDGDGGSKRLAAYIVPAASGREDVSSLRAHLRETLPEYMVPAVFVHLDEFPLTANKKVDRVRLPDPEGQRPNLTSELVGPRNETEASLARIWAELLGIDRIGVHDNFFDLGGDSLLALRCMMRANRAGMELTPISLFRHQTIAELAVAVGSTPSRDEPEAPIGAAPLTPAQLRFLTERGTPDPHHWNVSALVQAELLSPEALQLAVGALVKHHDALRLQLRQVEGGWLQEIVSPTGEIPFEHHDLSSVPGSELPATIERICTELQAGFDLGHGLLLRVAHFACGLHEPDRLFVTIHHFAVDGLSWGVFFEDLEDAYRQALAGHDIVLPPKSTSFRSWAIGLEQMARSSEVAETAPVWLGLPWDQVARLPADHDSPGPNTNASAAAVQAELTLEDTSRLLTGGKRPEHVVMAALAACLSRWTGSPTVLIDVLSHGRDAVTEGVNLSRTVAFALSYNPLVLSHATWTMSGELVDSVLEQVTAAPQGYTFDLLRFLGPEQGLRSHLDDLPRADVLFNYSGAEAAPDDELWRPAPESTGPEESPRGLRQYPLAVRATLEPNLRLTFVYSTELHTAATIETKAREVVSAIHEWLGLPHVSPPEAER